MELDDQVAALRGFNRFWTGVIHVLNAGLLDTPYTLTEARVIYELAQAEAVDLLELRHRLGIDPSYLTRIVQRFKQDAILTARPAPSDRRRVVLRLTERGREVYAMLGERSAAQNRELLSHLTVPDRRRLIEAMTVIRQIVAESQDDPPPVARRTPSLAAKQGDGRCNRRRYDQTRLLASSVRAPALT
jgi:DNA-binding MarR family transcriptional regulator